MSVTKDLERGTWTVYTRYIDWKGNKKEKRKRGFATKKEAQKYEREFIQNKTKDVNMGFSNFVGIYLDDIKPRLKYNTYVGKEYLINTKIIPYFKNKSLSEISSVDIIQWQNELLNIRDEKGQAYSQTYLRTIQNQLNAIFNHAYRYYGLKKNPCSKTTKMGKSKAGEMSFWTKDEYLKFIKAMEAKPISFYAFEILYWCGIREGELLALTRKDFDLENKTLTINKSYQRIKKKDYITSPKTEKSNRVVELPDFLCDELEDFFCSIYKCDENARLFPVTKSYLHHEIKRGCNETGVKYIKLHAIRHSHASYLIELGFSPVEIAERLGHESISVTFMYAHLYPSKQKTMASKINSDRVGGE